MFPYFPIIAGTDLFPVWVGGSVTCLGKQFVINTSPITLFITRPRVTTLHHQPGINDKQTTKRPSEASGQPGLLLILTSRGPMSSVFLARNLDAAVYSLLTIRSI